MFSKNARSVELDVSEGGAKYNNYGILTVGMANAVNSFANIKNSYLRKNDIPIKS